MHVQAYKKETLGQEALLREKEEAILMERKRRYGAPPRSLSEHVIRVCVMCFLAFTSHKAQHGMLREQLVNQISVHFTLPSRT